MYVCLCNSVTENQIRQFVNGQESKVKLSCLNDTLGVCNQCGKCGKHAHAVLKSCQSKN